MKEKVQKRSELLVSNRDLIHKGFMFENGLITTVAAATFTEKDKVADAEHMKECRKLLRDRKGAFSELRGNNELVVSAKMAVSENPEKFLDELIEVYEKFNKGKFFGSSYKVMASMTIVSTGKAAEADNIIEKTDAIIKGMKSQHPFLTSDEDICIAVLLAMTDKDTEDILAELEETFQSVKKSFAFHENAAYSLAQVLTTYGGECSEKVEKVLSFFDAFKEAGEKYGKDYELASLGTLIDIDADRDELVSEVIEVAKYLKGQKGFETFDMNKYTRLMFGAMIISGVYSDDNLKNSASVLGGTLAEVIAQETAMLVAIIAATTVTSTTSSNG
ncbi:DUF4003 family protein [Butyrivibrio sp. WCD3002]|uniref:DUF4003 family protein n=1 Tax=Butyrivibrio sp. WCD3002 TaxID=1280676 RepID=UPI000415539C|nr:DUF4003 family protein [Butyrivibrio sp. WCD3002]